MKRATNLPPQPNRQSGYGHQGQARCAGGWQGLSRSSAQGDVGRWNLRPWWQLQPVWPPMPTGSPSRYALHPCTHRHPSVDAHIASLQHQFPTFWVACCGGVERYATAGRPPIPLARFLSPCSLAGALVCMLLGWSAAGTLSTTGPLADLPSAAVLIGSSRWPRLMQSKPMQSSRLRLHRAKPLKIVKFANPAPQCTTNGDDAMACCRQLQPCSHHPTRSL